MLDLCQNWLIATVPALSCRHDEEDTRFEATHALTLLISRGRAVSIHKIWVRILMRQSGSSLSAAHVGGGAQPDPRKQYGGGGAGRSNELDAREARQFTVIGSKEIAPGPCRPTGREGRSTRGYMYIYIISPERHASGECKGLQGVNTEGPHESHQHPWPPQLLLQEGRCVTLRLDIVVDVLQYAPWRSGSTNTIVSLCWKIE